MIPKCNNKRDVKLSLALYCAKERSTSFGGEDVSYTALSAICPDRDTCRRRMVIKSAQSVIFIVRLTLTISLVA